MGPTDFQFSEVKDSWTVDPARGNGSSSLLMFSDFTSSFSFCTLMLTGGKYSTIS